MSTSYYARRPQRPPCECCKREYSTPEIHIGNSGGGWKFGFRSYDEYSFECKSGLISAPIKSARDWRRELKDWTIFDEYDHEEPYEAFWAFVDDKQDKRSHSDQWPDGNYKDLEGYEFIEYEFS